MKNSLDDFIHENRDAFDTREPSANVWKRIQLRMFENHRNALMYWRAAAILLMGLSAFLLYSRWTETRDNRLVMNEFTDVESFYVREIADKIDLIEDVSGGENGLNGYTHDFRQLEAMYEVLKDEMRVRPSKKVKDALILNLLIRIDLLNKQLDKLDKEEEAEEEAGARGDVSL
jgi:hypothetical protein